MNTLPENEVTMSAPANQWPLAGMLMLLTVSVGGYLGGCAIRQFGSLGAISLWALGGGVGWLASKYLVPHRLLGYGLGASVVIAFFVAETCWIHWRIVGAETWPAAIRMLPTFFREYSVDAFMGGLATFFGASSAFRQAS